jgi:hypothetical protein
MNAFVSAWALYSRFEEGNKARTSNANIWHAVLCDIEQRVLLPQKGDPHQTNAQINRALDYYDHLLVVDAHAAPCGLKRR